MEDEVVCLIIKVCCAIVIHVIHVYKCLFMKCALYHPTDHEGLLAAAGQLHLASIALLLTR